MTPSRVAAERPWGRVTANIRVGDCREVLASLADNSVQCVVTSPPYWGLRDYGMAGQLGLEKSPQDYVAKIVEVFREVRRVLRPDGTLWLNLGDSYTDSGRGADVGSTLEGTRNNQRESRKVRVRESTTTGLRAKNLVGIPWRVAFALQDDGWYLRSDIIWHKPNGMPESVTDRPTKSHEYVFLFAKSQRYYYDGDAVREPLAPASILRLSQPNLAEQAGSARAHAGGKTNGNMKAVVRGSASPDQKPHSGRRSGNKERKYRGDYGGPEGARAHQGFGVPWEDDGTGRNRRTVWTITTKPFSEAHFATMPPELARICILAGSARGGVVLDPFSGAGTTGLVCSRLDRDFIGIEINPQYATMARRRIRNDAPLFSDPEAA